MTPDDRKYVKTHEWVKIDDDLAIIGITDYAQDALGDITFIELPTVSDSIDQGHECGVIESVKAASDFYAPISGEVAAINNLLEDQPELINQDPYDQGWLFKVRNFDPEEIENLMDAPDYENFLEKGE